MSLFVLTQSQSVWLLVWRASYKSTFTAFELEIPVVVRHNQFVAAVVVLQEQRFFDRACRSAIELIPNVDRAVTVRGDEQAIVVWIAK